MTLDNRPDQPASLSSPYHLASRSRHPHSRCYVSIRCRVLFNVDASSSETESCDATFSIHITFAFTTGALDISEERGYIPHSPSCCQQTNRNANIPNGASTSYRTQVAP
jgi:hypothetical protein